MPVNERLKKVRLLNGLTQDEFLKEIGVKREHYGAMKRGKSRPLLRVVLEVSEKYNISLDWLLHDEGNRERRSIVEEENEVYKTFHKSAKNLPIFFTYFIPHQ